MSTFDLDAYLARIGYDAAREPTLATLAALQLAHTQAIPFENLDPILDRLVSLDLGDLQGKLVRSRRGGYCFEQNLLFQAALHALGFEASCLGGRVYLDRPESAGVPARTHLALRVVIEGRSYLADVGFGGQTPTAPLTFTMGEPRETPHERYRILPAGDERDLEAEVRGAWKILYRYGLDVPPMIDLVVANHYVATHPESFFRNAIMAARAAPNGRHTLINDRLSFHRIGGDSETRTVSDVAALAEALDSIFGITVPDESALGRAFDRVRSVPANNEG